MKITAKFAAPIVLPVLAAGWALAQEAQPSGVAAPTPATAGAAGDDFLPEAFDPQEHASTWSNPPFSRQVLPDAVEEAPQGPEIWDGWQIAAVDRFKGKFTVGLVTKKNEFRLIKEGETHEAEGVTLVSVESNGVISETVVHLSGGGRTGTLTFDQGRLSAGPKNAPKAPAQPVRTAPQRVTQPPATPQQAAARAEAKAQAQQQLNSHLNNTATNPNAAAGGAQPAAAGGAQPAAAPKPPTRTRRRSVVLPPSTR